MMLDSALAWIEAHPVLFTIALWPMITGAITWLFKPRTPAEFDAMWRPLALALKLLAASGVDSVKVQSIVKEILTKGKGPKDPPDPPEAGGGGGKLRVIVGGVSGLVMVCALLSCASAMRHFNELNDPGDDVALARCRKEGRAAKADGATGDAAYTVYEQCTREAGLR